MRSLKHGKGTYTYKDGSKFQGVFEDDKKSNGTLFYVNGDRYSGGFAGEEKSG